MTNKEYGSALANMNTGITAFIFDKWVKSIIPEKIVLTLQLLMEFIDVVKSAIFRDGRVLELSIWNFLRWWGFVKVARTFVNNIIDVWKETKQADTPGV